MRAIPERLNIRITMRSFQAWGKMLIANWVFGLTLTSKISPKRRSPYIFLFYFRGILRAFPGVETLISPS
jgi:hypothetical protein